MPSRKPTTDPPAIPRTAIAWCAWHESYSNTARPVRDSSGARLFACQSCRDIYELVPIADQP
ncbi:hypothetical protein [Streptomyces sp. T028]|uniref:hypothetical protein n=1 Tax=Streptomyces sp. T028 TaxID=3394379 RepID=UPI003A87DC56